MQIAFISHPDFVRHDMGFGHPECPERLQAIDKQLAESGIAATIAAGAQHRAYRIHPATRAAARSGGN